MVSAAGRSKKVRVCIVGVGNCASSFVQGLTFYSRAQTNEPAPGLMNVDVGGYQVGDVEISAAFDISANKVGRDVSEAIFAQPNNTFRFASVPPCGVVVDIVESETAAVDVADVLLRSGTDVVVSYLPTGSQHATEFYAECAIEAGCGFVNCIPVFVASDPKWRRRFQQAHLPIIGDDVKSQVGATIVHRVLVALFRERGVRLDRTYQLNFGGNSDFKNMLERERLATKKLSKTQSVMSQFEVPLTADDIHVGPSDHVPWLTDRKMAYIRLEGTAFGSLPINLELKLDVWDSPNSAGVVIDAVRCARLAMDRGLGGALLGPSSYFMKSPPRQFTDGEARARTIEFINGDGRRAGDH